MKMNFTKILLTADFFTIRYRPGTFVSTDAAVNIFAESDFDFISLLLPRLIFAYD